MARRWGWLGLVVPLALVALACKQETVITREVTDDDLRAMVLKAEDLPPGFVLSEEKLTDNEQFAQNFTDAEKVRTIVQDWGRAAGFENQFTGGTGADKPREPRLVGSAAERYSDIVHAKQAWEKENDLLPYMKTQLTSPTKIKNPGLGDQSRAERWYITDSEGRDLVLYSVSFRQGTVVAGVTTVTVKHKDDKGDHAIRLARLVHERVSAVK